MFEERSKVYIPKAISLAKVAQRLIERISNVKTERNDKDIITILIKERGNSQNLDSIVVPLFTIRNRNPKNSDCEMSWLVYQNPLQDEFII